MGAAFSRDKSTGAGRSALQRRIVAALIVSSEAWRCTGGAYKIRGASLSAKEGSGSGCALRPCPGGHAGPVPKAFGGRPSQPGTPARLEWGRLHERLNGRVQEV